MENHTVKNAVLRIKSLWQKNFQILCAIGANLMLCCAGFTSSASGFLIPQLEDPTLGFGITTEDGSWMASIKEIGSLIGAILGALQSEKLGRRRSLIIDSFLYIIGTLLTAFSTNFEMILVGRFIQGFSAASAMVSAPLYTCEISQPHIRRYTALFPVLCWDIGIAVSYILGALLPWRYAIGVTVLVPMACFLLLLICPESPTWFIIKGQEEAAKKALIKLRGGQCTSIQEEFERILFNKKAKESVKNQLKMMFDGAFVKPFGFLLILTIVGVLLCGGPIISYYKVPLLLEAKIPFDPYWTSAWMGSVRAILSCLALPFIGRFMKRTVHFFCSGILIVGLLSLSAFTYFYETLEEYPVARWIPIISILLIYASHSFGRESVIFALQGELLPAKSRSIGIGILGFLSSLVSFLIIKFVPTMFDTFGVYGTFLICAGFTIGLLIFSYFYMPETSGLTLEEIEDMYQTKRKKDPTLYGTTHF